jgi:hypothetical protein
VFYCNILARSPRGLSTPTTSTSNSSISSDASRLEQEANTPLSSETSGNRMEEQLRTTKTRLPREQQMLMEYLTNARSDSVGAKRKRTI